MKRRKSLHSQTNFLGFPIGLKRGPAHRIPSSGIDKDAIEPALDVQVAVIRSKKDPLSRSESFHQLLMHPWTFSLQLSGEHESTSLPRKIVGVIEFVHPNLHPRGQGPYRSIQSGES